MRTRPLVAALLFGSIVLLYYTAGYINYSRAGKIALTGMSSIGLLMALSYRYNSQKLWSYLTLFISLIFFLNLSFHAGLRDIFGVAQDEMMIMKAIFGTDAQESYEFLLQYKPYLLKHLLLFSLSFSIFYWVISRKKQNSIVLISRTILTGWILFFIFAHLEKSIRKGNPFVYFPTYYLEWQAELKELVQLNATLEQNIDSTMLSDVKYIGTKERNTVVWVIGESSTKYNWSLYGYQRQTTPLMDSIKDSLSVFQNIKAAAPITIPAFERMLTSATIKNPGLWKRSPSIIQIAKKAGYRTYWISNHTTDAHRGITYLFAHQADETYMTNRGKARGEGSYDESVLPVYQKALQDPYPKKFIIVHLLGSHPAYNFRYPKKYAKFTDTFDDTVAIELSRKGIATWAITFRNFYDNSILYGDYIRYTLLTLLQQSKEAQHAVWLYHPDHGEDVCHHTNFSGHNKLAKEQWEIPMVLWSKQYKKLNKKIPYQIDIIEHSILGLLKIKTIYYISEHNLFAKQPRN